MSLLRLTLLAAILAGGLLVAAPAAAGNPPPGVDPAVWQVAKEHFRRGAALYKEGRYADAETEFREAHRLSNSPDLLFNVALSAERQGKQQEALQTLERYLEVRPGTPDREQILARIETLRKDVEAKAAREAAERPAPPPPPPVVAPPPPPPVAALPPPPPRQIAPSRRSSDGPGRRPLGPAIGVTAGGGALLAVGLGLYLTGLQTARDIDDTPSGGAFDRALFNQGMTLHTAGLAVGAVGIAAVVAGTVWTAVLLHRNRSERRLALGPAPLYSMAHGGL